MSVNMWHGKKIQAMTASLWPTDFLFVSDSVLPIATDGEIISERIVNTPFPYYKIRVWQVR